MKVNKATEEEDEDDDNWYRGQRMTVEANRQLTVELCNLRVSLNIAG